MGCAASRIRYGMTRVCVTTLEQSVQTGDLILFSSKHAASHVTKCFTASTWDHCGLVVKLSPKHVFILEYAGGVYLYPLFTRLYSYYAIQGREICIRRLKTPGPRIEMQAQVEGFVKSVLGDSPPSIEEMVMAVLKQGPALNTFLSKLRGNSSEVEDDLSSLFCSKLVAAVYKHVGLIQRDRAAGDFLPKHFSQEFDGYIDLQGGASLSNEVPISFDAVHAEVEELKLRIAEREHMDRAIKPEVLLSLVSSLYLAAREFGVGVPQATLDAIKRLNCMPAIRSQPPSTPRLTAEAGGKAGGINDDHASTASPASFTSISTAETADAEADTEAARQGGLELTSGPIVAEVEDVDDGGIYSPTAQVYKSRTTGPNTPGVKLEFGHPVGGQTWAAGAPHAAPAIATAVC